MSRFYNITGIIILITLLVDESIQQTNPSQNRVQNANRFGGNFFPIDGQRFEEQNFNNNLRPGRQFDDGPFDSNNGFGNNGNIATNNRPFNNNGFNNQQQQSGSSVTQRPPTVTISPQVQCMRNCLVTSEYNPVCGSNGVTYSNPGGLTCAQRCTGQVINTVRSGSCPPQTSPASTGSENGST